jgi:hypothetical protein
LAPESLLEALLKLRLVPMNLLDLPLQLRSQESSAFCSLALQLAQLAAQKQRAMQRLQQSA